MDARNDDRDYQKGNQERNAPPSDAIPIDEKEDIKWQMKKQNQQRRESIWAAEAMPVSATRSIQQGNQRVVEATHERDLPTANHPASNATEIGSRHRSSFTEKEFIAKRSLNRMSNRGRSELSASLHSGASTRGAACRRSALLEKHEIDRRSQRRLQLQRESKGLVTSEHWTPTDEELAIVKFEGAAATPTLTEPQPDTSSLPSCETTWFSSRDMVVAVVVDDEEAGAAECEDVFVNDIPCAQEVHLDVEKSQYRRVVACVLAACLLFAVVNAAVFWAIFQDNTDAHEALSNSPPMDMDDPFAPLLPGATHFPTASPPEKKDMDNGRSPTPSPMNTKNDNKKDRTKEPEPTSTNDGRPTSTDSSAPTDSTHAAFPTIEPTAASPMPTTLFPTPMPTLPETATVAPTGPIYNSTITRFLFNMLPQPGLQARKLLPRSPPL